MPGEIANKINPKISLIEEYQNVGIGKRNNNGLDDSNSIDDEIWGFRITGGADFGMPLTVFHVRIFEFIFYFINKHHIDIIWSIY